MRETYYLSGREPLTALLLAATFPDYTGKMIRLSATDEPLDFYPPPEAGTVSTFKLIDMDTLEARLVVPLPLHHKARRKPADLPARIAAVQRCYERGKDTGIVIHVRTQDVSRELLPVRHELTQDEQIVLRYTHRYRASYGGDYRHRQTRARLDTGMSMDRWNAAREKLQKKGLLNYRFSITPAGRNELK